MQKEFLINILLKSHYKAISNNTVACIKLHAMHIKDDFRFLLLHFAYRHTPSSILIMTGEE